MSFPKTSFYVDANGEIYGAAKTDQAGSRNAHGRTAGGKPVAWIGMWNTSQMPWRPFKTARAEGVEKAKARTAARTAESTSMT